MRTIIKVLLLLAGSTLWGQITQSIVFPATGSASNSSVPAQAGDCRVEVFIQSIAGTVDNSKIIPSGNCGLIIQYLAGTPGNLAMYWEQGNNGSPPSACTGQPALLPLGGFSSGLYVRGQKTVAGAVGLPAKSSSFEVWDTAGNYLTVTGAGNTCTYAGLSGSYGTGTSVGDVTSAQGSTVVFVREYPTLVALQSTMPVTTPPGATISSCPPGAIFEWKFDNSPNDSCGTYNTILANTPCGALACYTSTGTAQNLVVSIPKVGVIPFAGSKGRPSWSPWITLKTGALANLDASGSFSQAAASSAVTYSWTQTQGPTASLSSTTVAQPTLTPPADTNCANSPSCLDYKYQLVVTDSNSNTSTTTLEFGSVSMDSNNVLIPSDPRVTDMLGPMIAFGQSPWGQMDKLHLQMIPLQATYQAAGNDFGWNTTGQGTVAYPFAGIGGYTVPGVAGTVLTSAITTATGQSIDIADTSKLPGLASLPDWILVGNSLSAVEMVRIDGCTSTGNPCPASGAANLHVAYDGRGLSGNITGIGGYPSTIPAQGWPNGTIVGELRVSGSSTLFSTDPNRPICPAGLPGPPGPVVYSTGTVALTASSTTIAGSGTSWTTGNGVVVGAHIRVTATHASGTPFVYWAQITTVMDTTHIVVDHPAPIGVDGSSFSYKITSPNLYLSLEFTAPAATGITSHLTRGLWNGVGCESETAMFALPTHDVPTLNTTSVSGAKYSYKTFLSEITQQGTMDPNFYGTGLAARNLYLRSGYTPALTLANFVDDNWVNDPQIGNGLFVASPFVWGGAVVGAMANILFNSNALVSWPGVETFAVLGETQAASCNATNTRDEAYGEMALSGAANWDSNATNRAHFKSVLGSGSPPTMLTWNQTCRRNAADGYAGVEVNSYANSSIFLPASTGAPNALTLTNGSTAVTGSGFTNGCAGGSPCYAGAGPPAYSGGGGGPAGYCYGVDIITITITNGSSTATVASGSLSQENLLYIYDGSNTYVAEYSVSGTAVQLAFFWPGATGTFSAMSTGGGPIVLGGQLPGGLGGIFANTSNSAPVPDLYANNEALRHAWACKYNSPTSLTLNRPWDGVSSSGLGGGLAYYFSYYNLGPFSEQPFFFGPKTNQMRWASKNDDPTIASGYQALLNQAGPWFNTYGWDPITTKGTLYNVVYEAAETSRSALPAGNFESKSSYQGVGTTGLAGGKASGGAASVGRVNSAEGGNAMNQYYITQCLLGPSQCDAARAIGDIFYGAQWGGDQSLCDPLVASTCDGTIVTQVAPAYMAIYKWPGFFYGMGMAHQWPALRLIGNATTTSLLESGPIRFSGRVSLAH